ncbi:hypothetical protein BCV39_12475 [Vibrio sp. 10N.286.55.E10]|uniref:hypothetical protein n=1 Tax=Vibrio TaxID=662 RepID=UPI000C817724|nr:MULTISPECIES: hypothetical protein [unclassified Vibrio]CAK3957923.1 conserved hypothetical protein [Vibrio crassostreae]PME38166.1 hypothetical protein BCV39_12475 [Vibrio sp. 10N.286.55.E10]PME41822.1 hypothetical protein BCV40_04615 [Vibrio sp. 10N.286.55.E12]PME64803.1 hypothetical protein BCV32_20740 [Vibrio sp. 10N.286.55.C11]PMI25115.1 hypothetical protein BCU50_00085 [Vibrio sp. 10N.286.46.E10]
MNKNPTCNRLANLLRLRRPYKISDFLVSSDELRVKKDVYSLRKIKQLETRQLGIKENAINVISLALMLSAATWAFVPQFGLPMLALTFILAFVSWRKYELRAEFKGSDETGDHWVSVARGCTREEFKILKSVEVNLREQVVS